MKVAKRMTPARVSGILGLVNIGHAGLALLSVVLLIWSLVTKAQAELIFGSILAIVLFTGLYAYTVSVRRILCRPPPQS